MFCIVLYLINLLMVITAEKSVDTCLTTGCIEAASSISKLMDQTVDPCDDFYSFACGNFVKETIIPDDKSFVETISITLDKVIDQVRTLVSVPVNEGEMYPFKLVKKLYKSCMNRRLIQDRGIRPLLNILEKLGGWPVLKGFMWDESSWTLQNFLLIASKMGYTTDYIFKFTVIPHLLNTTIRIIQIEEPASVLKHDYLVQGYNTFVQAYHSYQVDMAVFYGAYESRAEKEMEDVLEFEIALANISLPYAKRRDTTHHIIAIKHLQIKYPFIQWLEYFNGILPEQSQVNEGEIIMINFISFFDELGKLLENTPKRTLANYVMWRITEFSSFFLIDELRKRQHQYSIIVQGIKLQEPRWSECVNVINSYLPFAVGSLYVRKYFPKQSKKQVLDMVAIIKDEFKNILEAVTWMDNNTKALAVKKLKYMDARVGYPDELLNDKKLMAFYENVEFEDTDHYLESILKLNKFINNYSYNRLRVLENKTNWFVYVKPADANAHYSKSLNDIKLPAGILQGHMFATDRPNYVNYGAIGFVIGHEITHGFDNQGRTYDVNGNPVDWWQKDTKAVFLEKIQCLIEQYGNFTEPNVDFPLNGINTQGENIADNNGIKVAYLAYQKLVEKNGQEARLPTLNYSPNQMFWISAAQVWCSVYRPLNLKHRMFNNVHPPGKFRVLGSFKNTQHFANDFNCSVNTPMNPVNKCEVW